ncbi:MAG: PLP-dependent transferase [Acidobacteriaceae bacterium]|nr:PLP-dependent transferase [Acidobacteriaceae bacterium]MBV9294946.1 PLP-dependent transferase [Acidobacteriaceae bacterium]MBV9763950.1 PLP-dependent transferase [Acidobacteriaceae bacterium]
MPETKAPAQLRPETDVLTRGFDPSLSVGSARPAVFRSSTYVFSSPEAAERAFDIMAGRAQRTPEENVDLVYSRFNHPNAQILEDQIVPLEPGATAAAVFNSGMAAIMTALLAVLKPGDSIIYSVPIYGGTQTLIQSFLQSIGIEGIPVPAGQGAAIDNAIRGARNLRVVLIETPANPTIVMTDVKRVCQTVASLPMASSNGNAPERPLVMVDNTFLGPAFQHALSLGADVSLYSATKYLGGYSDIIGGVALTKDVALMSKIRSKRSLFGNILQPDECWILDTRLPTVALRMNRQSKNAQRIAEKLASHPKVKKVYYPTLFEDPEQTRIYREQCEYPGGLVSIDLKGGKAAAFDFLRRLKLARNAVSLGGVETLACHPRSTTHSAWSAQDLDEAGIGEGLVRISVGIEDWRDLLADCEAALDLV